MGRKDKLYKDKHIKFDSGIYERLEKYIAVISEMDGRKYNDTEIIEIAVTYYLNHHDGWMETEVEVLKKKCMDYEKEVEKLNSVIEKMKGVQ